MVVPDREVRISAFEKVTGPGLEVGEGKTGRDRNLRKRRGRLKKNLVGLQDLLGSVNLRLAWIGCGLDVLCGKSYPDCAPALPVVSETNWVIQTKNKLRSWN